MSAGSKKVFNLLVATLQEYEGQTNKVAQALKKHVRLLRLILVRFAKVSSQE